MIIWSDQDTTRRPLHHASPLVQIKEVCGKTQVLELGKQNDCKTQNNRRQNKGGWFVGCVLA